jgi:hypothetical protein
MEKLEKSRVELHPITVQKPITNIAEVGFMTLHLKTIIGYAVKAFVWSL